MDIKVSNQPLEDILKNLDLKKWWSFVLKCYGPCQEGVKVNWSGLGIFLVSVPESS